MKKRIVSWLLVVCLAVGLLAGILPTSASAVTTGSYIGYLVRVPGNISYNRPKVAIQTTGGYSYVPNIYIVDAATYQKWNTSNPGSAAVGQVAYCFNKSRHEPYNQVDGTWEVDSNIRNSYGRCYYNKIENASGTQFKELATGESESYSADELRNRLISVVLNGYPLDYSGFNTDADGNKILDDGSFRVLTQWAVWYYTDNYNALNSNLIPASAAARTIFYQLIGTVLPETVTNAGSSSLDLYQSTGEAFSGDTYSYQNLLAVTNYDTSDLPEYQTLTLKKSVTNLDGSTTSDDFTFTITLSTSDFWYETSGGANIKKSDKTLTVDLANNDSITLFVAANSYDYTITEAANADYKASATVGEEDASLTENTLSKTGVTTDTTVVFTNTEQKVETSTGIGELTLQKLVAENSNVPGSILSDTAFNFTVTLTKDGSAYTGPTADEAQNDSTGRLVASSVKYYENNDSTNPKTQTISADGTVTFTLKKDETVTMYLPAGVHYAVTEPNLPTNFSFYSSSNARGTITADTASTATITNQYNNSRKVYVSKVWEDAGNHTSHRTPVTFGLYKQYEDDETTKTLIWSQTTNSTANWSGYYTRDRYESGKLTKYSVVETSDHEGYNVGYAVVDDNITITNTYNESLLNTIEITKALAEGTPTTDQAFSFTVTLDDPNYDGTPTFKDNNGATVERMATVADIKTGDTTTGKQITFTLKDGETVTIPAIYSGTYYTVAEAETSGYDVDEVDGYYTSGTDKFTLNADGEVFEGTISNDKNTPWHISLKYVNEKEDTSATTQLTAKKEWSDTGRESHRPNSVQVTLYQKIGNGQETKTQQTYTLSASANWTYTVNNLTKKINGETVTYALKEADVPEGYEVSTTNSGNAYTFTNTYKEDLLNTLNITKAVTGEGADSNQAFEFTVTIYDPKYDGTPTGSTFTKQEDTTNGCVKYTFTLKAGETASFPALYSGTTYTVKEEHTDDYTLDDVSGSYTLKSGTGTATALTAVGGVVSDTIGNTPNHPYEITLTYTNKKTSEDTGVQVTKTWEKDSGHISHRPTEISFNLYQRVNNQAALIGTYTLTSVNNWAYTVSDLPSKVNGATVEYFAVETDEPEGYEASYNGTQITNTYNENLLNTLTLKKVLTSGLTDTDTTFTFTVTLDDPDYHATPTFTGSQGTVSIENITTDGKVTGKKITVTLKAGATVTFPDLYKGTTYTVTEETVSGYELDHATGYYYLRNGSSPTTLTATNGVFTGKIENTPDIPWNIHLIYTNKQAGTTTETYTSTLTIKKVVAEESTETSPAPSASATPEPSEIAEVPSSVEDASDKEEGSSEEDDSSVDEDSAVDGSSSVEDGAPHEEGSDPDVPLSKQENDGQEDENNGGQGDVNLIDEGTHGETAIRNEAAASQENSTQKAAIEKATIISTLYAASEESSTDTAPTFPFTVTIYNTAYNETPTGGNSVVRAEDSEHSCVVYTFSLKNGEAISFPNLASGTLYTVMEGTTSGYSLQSTSGYYVLASDTSETNPTTITATAGVFTETVPTTDSYAIKLTYTNVKSTGSSTSVDPTPTPKPAATPTPKPTATPTPTPTATPTPTPTPEPTPEATEAPTPEPSPSPSVTVTPEPSPSPSVEASPEPSTSPTPSVSAGPAPSVKPSSAPTSGTGSSSLPQTGAKWWPVMLLALAGLLVLTLGGILRKKHGKQ